MKTQTISCVLILVGFLFIPATAIAGPAGPPDGLDVTVVNPLPLPVTGDINATVEGGVNITNNPNVNIINEPTNPVPVSMVGSASCTRDIVNYTTTFTNYDPTTIDSFQVIDNVPEGRLLVIEAASVEIDTYMDSNTYVLKLVKNPDDFGSLIVAFPLQYNGTTIVNPGGGAVTVNTKAYVEEGQSVYLQWRLFATFTSGESLSYAVAVHGYYTDANCPQP